MRAHIPIATLVLLISPAVVPGLTAATANAEVITVCWDGSGDYLTIQEGIDAASDGDEVVVCDGVYTGPGNKNLDFHGKAITVRSANGPDYCVIYCQPDGGTRGFWFRNGETNASVLDGFTITNGGAVAFGSGVYCTNESSPTITNCTITGNTAQDGGGGVYCENSSPTIDNCTISGNGATGYFGYGAGVYCRDSSATITNCTISENTAEHGCGGGVHCQNSSPTITNCTITGNTGALCGGGICCEFGSSPTITNCLIAGNGNQGCDGGGISCLFESTPTITDCTISENTARDGGGISCEDSSPTIANCLIVGNGDQGCHGGGISCSFDSSPTITNCRITGNTASDGGGVRCSDANASISNCTITGNTAFFGGGVSAWESSPAITDCTITANIAFRGGGISSVSAAPRVTNCKIAGNGARSFGGGGGVYLTDSNPTITHCTIAGNVGRPGGGASCWDSNPTITNCTITGNAGVDAGGAVYCFDDCCPTITDCTISANAADNGRALACDSYAQESPSNVQIANCILWNGGDEICNNDESVITLTYSDVFGGWSGTGNIDAEPVFIWGPSGTWTAEAVYDPQTCQIVLTDDNAGWNENELAGKLLNSDRDSSPSALEFLIVANTATTITVWADAWTIYYGTSSVGPGDSYEVRTYHVGAGSPCIDAGCNWGVPPDLADLDEDGDTNEITPFDLDGEGRFFDDADTADTGCGCPPIVDMGAYEFGDTGPQACPGDLDCDRTVAHSDLAILLAAWHASGEGDLNCDGLTDHADLGVLLANWGNLCP